MKNCVPTLGLLLLLSVLGCRDKPSGNEVTSKAGKFSVRFPAVPKEDESPLPGLGIKAQGYILKVKDGILLASSGEVPGDAAIVQDPDKELDFIVNDTAQKNQAKLLGQEKLTIDGHPGREYRMEVSGGKNVIRTRMYYADKRLYALTATGTKDFVNSADTESFFKSFKLVK
jgi:hypothetical protein